MRSCNIILLILVAAVANVTAQQTFQLAPPLIKYRSVFFKDTVSVSMVFAQPGTSIYYSTNGTEPTIKSKKYKAPVLIQKHFTTLKAKVIGKEYLPSETVQATFIQQGLPVKSITFTTPHPNYNGNGKKNILSDNEGGIADFTNKNWLGFQTDTVIINIELKQPAEIHSVLLNVLQDYGSWIFFPSKAELFVKDAENKLRKINEISIEPKENVLSKNIQPLVLNIPGKITTGSVILHLHLLKHIPTWHQGSGQPGWLFIDEVKVF